jgi:hypothetical protein
VQSDQINFALSASGGVAACRAVEPYHITDGAQFFILSFTIRLQYISNAMIGKGTHRRAIWRHMLVLNRDIDGMITEPAQPTAGHLLVLSAIKSVEKTPMTIEVRSDAPCGI